MKRIKQYVNGALKSWTIWFNTTGVALLLLAEQNSILWKDYLGESANLVLFLIMAVNVALRVKTDKGLKDR